MFWRLSTKAKSADYRHKCRARARERKRVSERERERRWTSVCGYCVCVCVSEKSSLLLLKKFLQALTVLGEAELSADKCTFEDTFGPGCSLMGSRCNS